MAQEFLYAGVVYFSLWSAQRSFPFLAALGCTGLTFLGAWLSPPGASLWIDLANRFLGAGLVWITLELGLARRTAHEALARSHADLDSRVRERTAESSRAIESLQHELLRRTEADRLLAESRERYQTLFEQAPYPMWIADLDTLGFLDVNQAAVRHYGYSRGEFLAMTIKDIRPPEDVPRLLDALPKTADGPRTPGTWRHRKKDGTLIDVEIGIHTFDFAGRRARLTVVNDVTESLRATERLKESEERFRKIFEEAPIGMGIVGRDYRFVRVNKAFCAMVGYRQEELIGRTFHEITHLEDVDKDLQLVEEVFAGTRRSYQLEKRYVTRAGATMWGHLTVTVLREGEGRPVYLLGMIEDITEAKRAETMRTRLIDKIITAQEDERKRVARELHDGIGQTLTALAVGLRSMEDCTRQAEFLSQVHRLREIVGHAVEESGRIARGLRPSVLDDAGLEAALRQYLRDFTSAFRVAAELQVEWRTTAQLPGAVATALYRIIQEATTNAAKHAGAWRVNVMLTCGPTAVEAIIEDDGCGFEVEAEIGGGRTGLGIQGMCERAALLDGTVEIESSLGKGTTVYALIPMNEAGP